MDLTSLDAAVQGYFHNGLRRTDTPPNNYHHNGLASSTHRTYNATMRRFSKFCVLYDIHDPFPVTEKLMCYLATSLANDGLAPQMIKCYLSAVRSMQISLGLPPPSKHLSLPVLKRVLDGIRRCKVLGGRKPPRTRLPITTTVLRRIEAPLKECNAQDASAFWAIATTAFFEFFRFVELLVETESDYNPARHLKKSKCDQFKKGADILLGLTRCPLCPAGCAEEKFAGQSFRIGAATSAALAGIEDWMIQALGKWHSAAYLRYIRTPHSYLAALTTMLAK